MFRLVNSLPKKYWVAVSGGIDSVAVLHFFNKQSIKKRILGILHINHNTGDFANNAQDFVTKLAEELNIKLIVHKITKPLPLKGSKEMFWRDERYKFFHSFDDPIVLGHNFNDCIEEYIMNTMVRGYSSTIPYNNRNCIRPFLLWKRADIESYMERNGHTWVEDDSNADIKYKRNYIRHEILPKILILNPGVYNIVEKLIVER